MVAPKPISLTSLDVEDYVGPDPQPFVVVGGSPEVQALQAQIESLTQRVEALEALNE